MAVVSGVGHGVLKFTSNGGSVTGRHIVTMVRWVGATAASHTAVLTDTAGQEWFRSEADGANFIDLFPIYKPITGLSVAQSSGTFYVYTA